MKDVIVLQGGNHILDESELAALSSMSKAYNIEIKTMDYEGPYASILCDISIYVSEHFTELLLYGLLAPTAFETFKYISKLWYFRIKDKAKVVTASEIKAARPGITFKTCNGEVSASIPTTLSDEQFDMYMNKLGEAMQHIRPNPAVRYESTIIEQNTKSQSLEIKTMLQYAHQKQKEQDERETKE